DVADVGQIALRAQVAGLEYRGAGAALGGHQLLGEVGDGELRRLARADVVERPGPDDVEAGVAGVLEADQVGRRLAGGVGAVRPQLRLLVLDLPGPAGVPVDLAAAREQDAWPAAPAHDGVVEAARGAQVAGPGGVGLPERPADVGVARQVVDALGLDLAQDRLEGSAVA